MSVYMSAAEARKKTTIDTIIHSEIKTVETQIITDVAAGNLESTISTGTSMTNDDATGQSYFSVWQGNTEDRSKSYQMERVISYFQDGGYTVERHTNSSTLDTLTWKIYW